MTCDLKTLCCPRCRSRLIKKEGAADRLFCDNWECKYSEQGFGSVRGQPVLIDFDDSILSQGAFDFSEGASYVARDVNRNTVKTRITEILLGTNRVAPRCCSKFLAHLKSQGERPRILVIGGGTLGSGADDLYRDSSIELIGTDIYPSTNTAVIADGHKLPFIDSNFDGVWIQAVLEHVLDPAIVVAEIYRVLRPGGMVYADTPFMQQVHEGAYDFTRFTLSGHRWLFRNFEAIEAGTSSGAGTALRWSIRYLIRSLTGSNKFSAGVSMLFFWTRFFDNVAKRRPNADAACGVYFLGTKAATPLAPHAMIKFYEQQSSKTPSL